ncbi:MAG TPA: response regulator [Kofleriaceae bacterium]
MLVVDDNEDLLELTAEILRAADFDVRTALDGTSALSEAREFPPDVALLDLGLPAMTGTELAARLRELLGPGVRLIAVSGYKPDENAPDFDEQLLKPVSPKQLLDAVRRA